MKNTSLTRALFVAGVMAAAAGMAQADVIFYPDGTHVELGQNAVENGLASSVLAQSSATAPSQDGLVAMGVSADQNGPLVAYDDTAIDTTALGAGPSSMTTTTVTTTTPVYVFPNINFDSGSVLLSPHPMMSRSRALDIDRTAAATFDTPTRAGEVSTMTAGVPNLLTTNESVASVPPPLVDTTALGAGPSSMTWYGTSSYDINSSNQMNLGGTLGSNNCASNVPCNYLPN